MAKIKLQLPTIQNWSCQSCGNCCRQHLIAITAEERDRILKQNWTVADGIADPERLVEKYAGGTKERSYRLAHQEDGSCVFLDENNLCRIHAKFGEPAKPLACRIYPYAFHPAGNQIAIGVRFSCPSVVANVGRAVTQQSRDLQLLADEVVPGNYRQAPPPPVRRGEIVEWAVVRKIVDALDSAFAEEDAEFPLKLLRAVSWVGDLEQMTFANVKPVQVAEILELLTATAAIEAAEMPESPQRVSSIGRAMFRLLLSIYGRKETQDELDSPIRSRWLSFRSTVRFAWGGGKTPNLHRDLPAVPFARIEGDRSPLPAESHETLTRYFRMKIQGMHFCGRAYYDFPLTTGFYSLALMYPVIVWLARWIAIGKGHSELTQADVELAMTIADHHQGYSPVLGLAPYRKRVEYLQRLGDLPRLIVNYTGEETSNAESGKRTAE